MIIAWWYESYVLEDKHKKLFGIIQMTSNYYLDSNLWSGYPNNMEIYGIVWWLALCDVLLEHFISVAVLLQVLLYIAKMMIVTILPLNFAIFCDAVV